MSRASCRSSRWRPSPANRSCCTRRASRTFPISPPRSRSKYEIWTIFGWPYETSATMARLIFSGIMTRFPDLKVMAHHLGAMIPFFDARIETGWATLGSRTSGEDYSHVLPSLGKPLLDCFRQFYGDTALCGGRAGTVCGHRVLRGGPRPVRVRRAVRSGGRRRLHSIHDGGDRLARPSTLGQGEDLLPQRDVVLPAVARRVCDP